MQHFPVERRHVGLGDLRKLDIRAHVRNGASPARPGLAERLRSPVDLHDPFRPITATGSAWTVNGRRDRRPYNSPPTKRVTDRWLCRAATQPPHTGSR